MNEMAFGLKVAEHLSMNSRQVPPGVAARLRTARSSALSLQPDGSRGSLSWFALKQLWSVRVLGGAQLRSFAAVMAVLLIFWAGSHWSDAARVDAKRLVDAALLTDDLPIEAYLDPEFRAWLATTSRS